MPKTIDRVCPQSLPATITKADEEGKFFVNKKISYNHGISTIGLIRKSGSKWELFCCGVEIGFSMTIEIGRSRIDQHWMSNHSRKSLENRFQDRLVCGNTVKFTHATANSVVAETYDQSGIFQSSWDLKGNFSCAKKGDKSMNLIFR